MVIPYYQSWDFEELCLTLYDGICRELWGKIFFTPQMPNTHPQRRECRIPVKNITKTFNIVSFLPTQKNFAHFFTPTAD